MACRQRGQQGSAAGDSQWRARCEVWGLVHMQELVVVGWGPQGPEGARSQPDALFAVRPHKPMSTTRACHGTRIARHCNDGVHSTCHQTHCLPTLFCWRCIRESRR